MHRRWLFISAAVALIVISLTVVLFSDADSDADRRAAATPDASAQMDLPHAPDSPTTSPRTTHTARTTPSATASSKPSAERTPRRTTAPQPSATRAPQPASAAAPLAGRIRPGATYQGIATFYDADGTGACLYDASSDVMTAAMNHTDYESAKACGAYVLVRAADGTSVTVRVTNECPECAPGHIDLSAQAFAELATPSAGRIPVTWQLVSPGGADPLSIRYKTGSSQYWCGIQAIGHRNPVARLEVRAGSGWRALPRAEYNYFLSEDGAGCGGAIRITDIYGEQLTVQGIAVRPNVVQPTGVQFAAR
ncbi:expansin EXLX1 family cellulose-binding protein [Streptomyces sp. NPDC050803]|uniref:expansin EXLX1 family cellulose-binding protein n=1 Tax=unclassified Streptomyces TaxID=2593676 RepID=UPI003418AD20